MKALRVNYFFPPPSNEGSLIIAVCNKAVQNYRLSNFLHLNQDQTQIEVAFDFERFFLQKKKGKREREKKKRRNKKKI